MLGRVLSLPLTGPLNMTMWLVRTLAERAEAELYDEGEFGEEDFHQAEDDLMERLKESRRRAEAQSR